MPTELRSPFGDGTATVPDDLVAKYRAEGWAPVAPPPEPAKPKGRATRGASAVRK